MALTAYEGVVEKGKIRLKARIRLPENTKVYVVVPEDEQKKTARVSSPRLAHRKQAADFKMLVSEEKANA
jgi:hypothetical protein